MGPGDGPQVEINVVSHVDMVSAASAVVFPPYYIFFLFKVQWFCYIVSFCLARRVC